MTQVTSEEAVRILNKEYRLYIDKLRISWLNQNQVRSNNVLEVMTVEERRRVHGTIARWGAYITPLAEAWWKERGYAVVWPDNDSDPITLRKLEST